MDTPVVIESNGPAMVLKLNDPDRANPLSAALVDALTNALRAATDDAAVRAVILAGAGRHFSAGADLAALQQVASGSDSQSLRRDSEALRKLFEVLLDHPKPTLAAVHGAAIGGGCGLATACDVVVTEPRARFAYTEITIGYVPALVLTFLTRRVPGHLARRLLLDPERIDGARAVAIGLADELAADGTSLERALELATSMAHKGSPAAIAATKKLLNETAGMDWREALKHAAAVNADHRMHPECVRGVKTFLEHKRTPDWFED
ncbi:MAG: enoyl-CoA hydratase-related protein [Thermoanaerobaculales bacterium]|jgi:methylglutaconyl-CoA hydratase|nr:enoyl-CoA hydratase-related protein [Thermoanaerobaculales bacterium]